MCARWSWWLMPVGAPALWLWEPGGLPAAASGRIVISQSTLVHVGYRWLTSQSGAGQVVGLLTQTDSTGWPLAPRLGPEIKLRAGSGCCAPSLSAAWCSATRFEASQLKLPVWPVWW